MAQLRPDIRPDWESQSVWNEEQWAEALGTWLRGLPADVPLFSSYDVIPGMDPALLSPAGFLYAWHKKPIDPPWERALAFWKSAPRSFATDPVARELLARWTFNFGAYALQLGRYEIGWEALLTAVHVAPDDPEIYYLLGKALGSSGRLDDAHAMFAAAADLAPYRKRYRRALSELSQALVLAP